MCFPDVVTLRALAKAVTDKDWHVGRDTDNHWAGQISVETVLPDGSAAAKVLFSGNANFPQDAMANAAYVAAANPSAILAMLDYIDALEARVGHLTLASMSEPPQSTAVSSDMGLPDAEVPSALWKLAPRAPTREMIDAGAQALVRWEGDCSWPDSWDPLQVTAARQDAERVWRSMAAVAPAPLTVTGHTGKAWKDHQTGQLVNQLTAAATAAAGTQQLRAQISKLIVPLAAQLSAPLPVAATPALRELAKAVQAAVSAAYAMAPVQSPYPPAEVDIDAIVDSVLQRGPFVRLPLSAEGYAVLPQRETREMHEAVMTLLYKGTARNNTQTLLDAYTRGAQLTELKAMFAGRSAAAAVEGTP